MDRRSVRGGTRGSQCVFQQGGVKLGATVENAFHLELSTPNGPTRLETRVLSWPLDSTPDRSDYSYDLQKPAFIKVASPASGQPGGG